MLSPITDVLMAQMKQRIRYELKRTTATTEKTIFFKVMEHSTQHQAFTQALEEIRKEEADFKRQQEWEAHIKTLKYEWIPRKAGDYHAPLDRYRPSKDELFSLNRSREDWKQLLKRFHPDNPIEGDADVARIIIEKMAS